MCKRSKPGLRFPTVAAAITAALIVNIATAESPRNVLLLIADDVGLDLGSYGSKAVPTPNLDRLAADGVRFTNAFCTTSSCSASRSVIYSGLFNHTNGQFGHAHLPDHFRQYDDVETMFTLLARHGYRTGILGKLHVEPASLFPSVAKAGPLDHRSPSDLAATTKNFLADAGDKPFLLVVGFADAHRARHGFDHERAIRGAILPELPKEIPVPFFLPDLPESRRDLSGYYQAVGRLDQCVGSVLAALEQSGQGANTLVLFTSDNGMPFPGAKTNLYDPGIRLPLLVRSPTLARRGIENEAMVSFIDLLPTVLEWTGAPAPVRRPLPGRSFLSILDQTHPTGWDEVLLAHTFHEITMYYPMRGIRTRQYKLIHNLAYPLPFPHASDLFHSPTWRAVRAGKIPMLGARPTEQYLHRPEYELYDLAKDPRELENRARDPAYAEIQRNLAERVRAMQQRTRDPWRSLDEQREGP